MKLLFLMAIAAGACVSCADYRKVLQGNSPGNDESKPVAVVVNNLSDMKVMASAVCGGSVAGKLLATDVDFAREQLVLISPGYRSSFVRSVSIARIERGAGLTKIVFREDTPSSGSGVPAIATCPYLAMVMEKTSGDVQFVQE